MASIICGNCKQTHIDVAEVKACYAGRPAARSERPQDFRYDGAGRTQDSYRRLQRATREEFTKDDSGIYYAGGKVFKVYINQMGDRMLCKELVLNEGRDGSWVYQGMANRFVKKSERITKEQAAQFGAIYGVCAICGRLLTDEQSIERGIGPVCYAKVA